MTKLCIPVEALNQHAVVLGKTGAGKSSALRHIVEHLLRADKRVVIIDPKGDWWGLKSDADGKGAGFPIITFGDFKEEDATDVPINMQSGKHVAELISTGNRPAIVGFRGWMTSHMVQFWIDFASTLFKENVGELYLVVDEVHNFAPKGKIMDPQAGKCLHWTNRLMSEGRGLGIVALIASQRPQKVHNDTLTSCETLVAMRVVHAADRGAVQDWIEGCGDKEQGKLVLNRLAVLQRGAAWVWSPEIRFGPVLVDFPLFETFDSFAPPQLQKKVQRKGWASVDLDAVKEKLARVIEEQTANDPRELKKQLSEARGLIFRLQKEALEKRPTEIKEVSVLKEADFTRLEKFAGHVERELMLLRQKLGAAKTHTLLPDSKVLFERLEKLREPPKIALPPQPVEGVSRVQFKILNALAELDQLGSLAPKRNLVAILAGYTHTASTGFAKALSGLSAQSFVSYPGNGTVALTDKGRALAQAPLQPSTPEQVQQRVYELLGGKTAEILRPIVAAYPGEISRTDVMTASGYSNLASTGFTKALSRLSSLGFVFYPNKGTVKASPILFLE